MKDGFIKVAAVSPKVRVADVEYNCKEISAYAKDLADKGAKVIVFPELSITGYTCQDLFFQDKLITAAKEGMIKIADTTRNLDAIIFVGL
ncbi:MAG: NAD(+) synthase, partial [Pseudobutyrivibrio sp.]|nr:NAD(+) synthase [Pseudobutyrivibrio sp.]